MENIKHKLFSENVSLKQNLLNSCSLDLSSAFAGSSAFAFSRYWRIGIGEDWRGPKNEIH